MTSTDATLRLPRSVREDVVSHARDGVPEEVCGVLGGRHGDPDGDSGPLIVEAARRVPNVADAPRVAYELDPAAALEAMEAVESAGRSVVGFYHTHPDGPPCPSATDRAEATWPGYVYLIVTPDGGAAAWRWTGERFDPVEVVTVEG